MIYQRQERRQLRLVGHGRPQQVRPEAKRGPTPILPPALALPHTESASITGGYVYRGKKFKDLAGVYICGDWVTRKVWGTRSTATIVVA